MKIQLRNRKCKYIIGGADNLLPISLDKEIRNYLSVMADGHQFVQSFRENRWDGKVKYVNKFCEFPTGFLESVIQFCEELGADVEVQDLRNNPIIIKSTLSTSVGNDEGFVMEGEYGFQMELIKNSYDKEVGGHPFIRGIWFYAPDTGKTSIMCGFMNNIENLNALIIVDRAINYIQTLKFLRQVYGDKLGEVQGKKMELDKPIVLAMAKTLCNLVKKRGSVGDLLAQKNVIICDEAHRAGSDTYQTIYDKSDCYSIILMSGTALDMKSHNKKLILVGVAGKVLATTTASDLVKYGVSLPTKVKVHLSTDGRPYSHFNSVERYKKAIVESFTRSETIIEEFNKDTNQVALLCVRTKEHGQLLYERLKEEYKGTIRVEFSHGEDKFRDEKLDDLKAGNISLFVTTSILQESANIPCITTIFYMQAGESKIAMKQYNGRGARQDKNNPNLKELTIHDFWDVTYEKSSRMRIKIWMEQKFDVEILYEHNRQYSPKIF